MLHPFTLFTMKCVIERQNFPSNLHIFAKINLFFFFISSSQALVCKLQRHLVDYKEESWVQLAAIKLCQGSTKVPRHHEELLPTILWNNFLRSILICTCKYGRFCWQFSCPLSMVDGVNGELFRMKNFWNEKNCYNQTLPWLNQSSMTPRETTSKNVVK